MKTCLIVTIHGPLAESSKTYRFEGVGPFSVGYGSKFDISLKDDGIGHLLDLKVAQGVVYITVMDRDFSFYLKNAGFGSDNEQQIVPFHECQITEGQILSLRDSDLYFSFALESEAQTEAKFDNVEIKANVGDDFFNDLVMETIPYKSTLVLPDFEETDDKINLLGQKKHDLEKSIGQLEVQNKKLSFDFDQSNENLNKIDKQREVINSEISKLKVEYDENKLLISKNELDINSKREILNSLDLNLALKTKELDKLESEKLALKRQLDLERSRLQNGLQESENILNQKNKLMAEIDQNKKEASKLKIDIEQSKLLFSKLKQEVQLETANLEHLKESVAVGNHKLREVQRLIELENEKIQDQSKRGQELSGDLLKTQEILGLKKMEASRVEHDIQSKSTELLELKNEISKVEKKLNLLVSEEQISAGKLRTIKDEYSIQEKIILSKTSTMNDEYSQLLNQLKYEKSKLELERENITLMVRGLKAEYEALKDKILIEEKRTKDSTLAMSEREDEIKDLNNHYSNLLKKVDDAKLEFQVVQTQKHKCEQDILNSNRRLKMLEVELSEKKNAADLEIEKMKRQETLRIEAEKNLFQIQLESKKQADLNDLELKHQKNIEEISQLKLHAQVQANELLEKAKKREQDLIDLAQKRLQEATDEAKKREEEAYKVLREAKTIHKNKEFEQDENLKSEFESKKKKMKSFFEKRHQQVLENIKRMEDEFKEKCQREELKRNDELEMLKRKELKKISILQEEELAKNKDLIEKLRFELKLEKEKSELSLEELRIRQETELEEKKRTVLEHLNMSQVSFNEKLEKERKEAEVEFEKTKRLRVENATSAIMNVLQHELKIEDDQIQFKIKESLSLALNGVNANAHHKMGQVLDFNPKNYKEFIPVVKKYGLRSMPFAAILLVSVDAFGIRSSLISSSAKLLKQNESATDLFVKQQKKEWKEKYTYNPETTIGHKESYTDNLLYTTNFLKVMEDQEFQNDWILKLHDFMVKDLELSEDLAINYISLESAVLNDLEAAKKEINPQNLAIGIDKMKQIEKGHLGDFEKNLETSGKLTKFNEFKKSYFNKFYEGKFSNTARLPASELK